MRAARRSWEMNGTLFEKYSAATNGASGGGGEYVPQTGFGWSAGVAAAFILSDIASASPAVAHTCSLGDARWAWSCWTGAAQAAVVVASAMGFIACVGLAVRWYARRKRRSDGEQPLLDAGY